MKKTLSILALVLAVVMLFAACDQPSTPPTDQPTAPPADVAKTPADTGTTEPADNGDATTPPADTAPVGSPLKIGVSVNATSNIHNQSIFEWTQEIGKERGHEMIATNGNGIAAQQVTDIENLMQQGCNAIIVQNGDKDGLKNVIEQAADAGIYIISYESGWVDGVSAMFNMNEFEIASELYMKLAAEMSFEGEVIQVSHPDHPAVRSRRYVQDSILKEYTQIKSVNQVTSAFPGTVEITFRGVESALQANPNVKAIWCTQDLEAMGALQACQALGRDDIIMIGVDGEADVLKHLQEGGKQIIATGVGDHRLGCLQAIEACEKLAAGQNVPAYFGIPYDIITAANVNEFMNAHQ